MANILLIDDELVLLTLMSTALRRDGHTVTALSDPLAALAVQAGGQVPIDLIVTDISMKPISGFQLVNRIIGEGFAGPVLFTSGYPAFSDTIAHSLGVHSVLEKPFTVAQLETAVRRALKRGARET